MPRKPLYRLHELAYRTQYAEVKERVTTSAALLSGTPGSLYLRSGTGHDYWYRIYYPIPGMREEQYVGSSTEITAVDVMRERIAAADWTSKQVGNLRKLGYQVADKGVAAVLLELNNRGLFDAGLTVVGTLAYMGWLNEFGAMAIAARTQDVDLARRQRLKLAAPISFLASLQASRLPFVSVPGMPSQAFSTSLKFPGREGLRVDLLAHGPVLGRVVQVPELQWHAQAIPHYDYLLEDAERAAMLAGGHCIPIMLPRAERMLWHKLYASSHQRSGEADKAEKDLFQAATLAAIVTEQGGSDLRRSFAEAPTAVRVAALQRIPRALPLLEAHPETLELFRELHG